MIGWRHFNSVIDPRHEGKEEDIGRNKIDMMGQTDERPYLERQKSPGDWDAIVAQGPVVARSYEHLSSTDKGVALMRRQLKAGISEVQAGKQPLQPRTYGKGITPTYNNETILSVPQREGDDQAVLRAFGHKVCATALNSEHLPVGERQTFVEQAVREMLNNGALYDGLSSQKPKTKVAANV